MKNLVIVIFAGLSIWATTAHADDSHSNWINLESLSTPVYQSAQKAQGQIAKVGRTDTSTRAGRRAQQLIRKGKILQAELLKAQGKTLTPGQVNQLKALIRQMDQASAKPAKGSQGGCFKSCDNAYGKGFGGGKGWNRFWCKASCFKININVGKDKPADPGSTLTSPKRVGK